MIDPELYKVLLAPHVSEKTVRANQDNNVHCFKIASASTKLDVRRAVEAIFSVKVKSVRVVNRPGKVKRFGQMLGRRSAVKKAYVRLEPGHEIDFSRL